MRPQAGSKETVDAQGLTQGGGDQAFEGLARYFAAAHQPVEDQSVDAVSRV